jgi:hypothetical protein
MAEKSAIYAKIARVEPATLRLIREWIFLTQFFVFQPSRPDAGAADVENNLTIRQITIYLMACVSLLRLHRRWRTGSECVCCLHCKVASAASAN